MSRFERKILFAIGLSVFLALGGSIFLAQGALREVYRVGVNERFGAELVHGVEARRGQLMALRSSTEQAADAIQWAVEAELARKRGRRRNDLPLSSFLKHFPMIAFEKSSSCRCRCSRNMGECCRSVSASILLRASARTAAE